MATHKRKETGLRRTRHRRVKQVQGQPDRSLQALEAFLIDIQSAVDTHRNSKSKRPDGSIWTDVYLGLGEIIRKIHYALQARVLRSGAQPVHVEPKKGLIRKNSRADLSAALTAKCRRLFEDAGVRLPSDRSFAALIGATEVPGHGERVHNQLEWEGGYGPIRGRGKRKVSPNR